MKKKLEFHIAELSKAVEAVPWEKERAAAAFLAQTFYYVRHSTRLLAFASSKFALGENTAHARFLKHAREETNHELLAKRDLSGLGFTLEQIPEFASIRAFYQTQYGMIESLGPWSMMGYVLVLEAGAVAKSGWLCAELKKHHGDKVTSFQKVHSEEDQDHIEQALKLVASAPASQHDAILGSMETTTYLYCHMLQDCAAFAASTSGSRTKSAA